MSTQQLKESSASIIRAVFDGLPTYWKLATVRCCIYAMVVGWGVWKAGVNGFASIHPWQQSNESSSMTPMQFWTLLGDVMASMLMVWMAFIDNASNSLKVPAGTQINSSTDTHSVTQVSTPVPAVPATVKETLTVQPDKPNINP